MLLQLPLLLFLLMAPQWGHGCQGSELDRELVLAKVRSLFLDALGPPAVTGEGGDPGGRRLPRRHAMGGIVRRRSEPEEEDVSQAILFPAAGNEDGEVGAPRSSVVHSMGLEGRQIWVRISDLPLNWLCNVGQLLNLPGPLPPIYKMGTDAHLSGFREMVYSECTTQRKG